jgi:siroheme synthase-like protein
MRLFGRPQRKTFPLNLIIDEKCACVVGGGKVGARKVGLLLSAGAEVKLICPKALTELNTLAEEGKITYSELVREAKSFIHKVLKNI